jgi:VIT1/CCC1 family predicted Fe2+/Mn2+ transporter
LIPDGTLMAGAVFGATLLCLALLGALGARLGGAAAGKAVWRVTFWGALAMAGTAGAGSLFGALVQ